MKVLAALPSVFAENIASNGAVLSGTTWGKMSSPGMFTFGDFSSGCESMQNSSYSVYEIPFFVVRAAASSARVGPSVDVGCVVLLPVACRLWAHSAASSGLLSTTSTSFSPSTCPPLAAEVLTSLHLKRWCGTFALKAHGS